jgi:hypothetical protein
LSEIYKEHIFQGNKNQSQLETKETHGMTKSSIDIGTIPFPVLWLFHVDLIDKNHAKPSNQDDFDW